MARNPAATNRKLGLDSNGRFRARRSNLLYTRLRAARISIEYAGQKFAGARRAIASMMPVPIRRDKRLIMRPGVERIVAQCCDERFGVHCDVAGARRNGARIEARTAH